MLTLQPGHDEVAQLTIDDADMIGSCTVVSETHMVMTTMGANTDALITIPATDADGNIAIRANAQSAQIIATPSSVWRVLSIALTSRL